MKNFFRKPFFPGIVLVIAGLIGCSNPYDPPQEGAAPRTASANAIEIDSALELSYIGDPNHPDYPLSGDYILIDSFSLTDWTPIGNDTAYFTGTFNGNKQTLTLQSFDSTAVKTRAYLGIFARVWGASSTAKAEIKDLTIISSIDDTSDLATGQAIGLLTGYTAYAEISNITLSGSFTFKSPANIYVGGIVGYAEAGTDITGSTTGVTMTIDGGAGGGLDPDMFYNFVGGLVGMFKGYEEDGVEISSSSNTGNVSGVCTTDGAQVFCGGIAGGSFYQFTTAYQGSIQNCWSTGTITAQCPGFWSWAGGIAGCIVGNGDGALIHTTRIVDCYATGTVTVAGSKAGWPYVGGIVGYNYYGALVSQSYFNGSVLSDSGSDYVGGIAGYNSQYEGHNSRIEDCWSAGTVSGRQNAGGIVGQNQIETYIRRCYSIATVEAGVTTSGVGGIAGLNASKQTDSVTACVALNKGITVSSGSDIHRIVGRDSAGTLSNNYALDSLVPYSGSGGYVPDKGTTRPDGQDATAAQLDQSFYQNTLGWDFKTVWKWNATSSRPELQWQQ
jgi:hypothetical protein